MAIKLKRTVLSDLIKKWNTLSTQWKIAIVTIIATAIIAIPSYPFVNDYWVQIQSTDNADCYVFVFRQDWSAWIENLTKPTGREKITIHPISAPKEVSDVQVPLKFFNWNYSEGQSLFTIYCENRGNTVESAIKVKISFPSLIANVDLFSERVNILGGGKMAGYIDFSVNDLLPDERQGVSLIVNTNEVKDISAWCETKKDLEDIFYYQIIFEKQAD